MGDVLPDEPIPGEIDQEKLQAAMDTFYADGAMSASVVVTFKGQIIAVIFTIKCYAQKPPVYNSGIGEKLTGTLAGVFSLIGVGLGLLFWGNIFFD